MRRFSRLAATVLTVLAATACGTDGAADTATSGNSGTGDQTTTSFVAQLFSSDFQTVCAGATQSKAAPYAVGEPGPHKVILMQGPKGEMYESTVSMPEDWLVKWTQEGDALAAIELVACSERVPGDVVKECDGYEDSDGKTLDTKVKLRNATYNVTLREAKSAKEVASTTIEAVAEDCPMIVSSDDTESFAENNLAIVEFLRPHVQGA